MGAEQFVQNPRRFPRLPSRCAVHLLHARGHLSAEMLDVSPGGCQVATPAALPAGAHVGLQVVREPPPDAPDVLGRVVWARAARPARIGVAFAAAAASWIERVVKPRAQLSVARRGVPDRLPLRASVYLGAPPRQALALGPAELAILAALGRGLTLGQLRDRLGGRWEASRAALFALLAVGAVTLSPSEASPPAAWRQVLFEAELGLAVDAVCGPGEQPPLPEAALARSSMAQHHLERALEDLRSRRVPDALAHLRIAASVAPGDPLVQRLVVRLSRAG